MTLGAKPVIGEQGYDSINEFACISRLDQM